MKLVEKESSNYNFKYINWGYSKGDTYKKCVILTKKFGNLKEIDDIVHDSTANKLYVAMTRTEGDLYILIKSKFDLVKNRYLKIT